ncbi:MAG: hypothetical protein J6386_17290 [Candidatus Synoicihabitans palmerolidicus]|nr:hypothetical protein [Candidatus Synoicihabitans palmerolidicus]
MKHSLSLAVLLSLPAALNAGTGYQFALWPQGNWGDQAHSMEIEVAVFNTGATETYAAPADFSEPNTPLPALLKIGGRSRRSESRTGGSTTRASRPGSLREPTLSAGAIRPRRYSFHPDSPAKQSTRLRTACLGRFIRHDHG